MERSVKVENVELARGGTSCPSERWIGNDQSRPLFHGATAELPDAAKRLVYHTSPISSHLLILPSNYMKFIVKSLQLIFQYVVLTSGKLNLDESFLASSELLAWMARISTFSTTSIAFFNRFLPCFYLFNTNFLSTITFQGILIGSFFPFVLPFRLRCVHFQFGKYFILCFEYISRLPWQSSLLRRKHYVRLYCICFFLSYL